MSNFTSPSTPCCESTTEYPSSRRACYDEGKRCAETLFFDYHRQHNLQIRVIRIFNTYGPRMHPNDGRVVSNFIVQALKEEPITLYGTGSQSRSFCKEKLRWEPTIPLREVLIRTIDYFRTHSGVLPG